MTDDAATANKGLNVEEPDVLGTPEGDNEFAPDEPLGPASDAARERNGERELLRSGGQNKKLPE